jgi:peptide/nickel transport system permease protein
VIRFILHRFVSMIVILLFLTAVIFLLQKISRTDPVRVMVGANAPRNVVEAERHSLGLDRPVPVQYVRYVWGMLQGNLQISYTTRQPVASDLASFIPATAELAVFGFCLAITLGLIIGTVAGARWRSGGSLNIFLIAGASVPSFLLAMLGIWVLFGHFGWLPASGRTDIFDAPTGPTGLLTIDGLIHGRFDVVGDALRHLLLPGMIIAIAPALAIARMLRGNLRANLSSDFVRTARAKGLPERTVVRRHALRNSSGPVISMAGLQVGLLFAGVVVVEQIFAWPGIGHYTAEAIPRSDFPAIAGVTLVLGATYVVVNAIVDVLQAIADPRIVT